MKIMYYGKECPHCHKMMHLLEKLKQEHNITIKTIEVWYNQEQWDDFLNLSDGKCDIVPSFYDDETKEFICGPIDYDKLVKWSL